MVHKKKPQYTVLDYMSSKQKVYSIGGALILVLSLYFLLMPARGEVYFSESECTTGMRVTIVGTSVKFETDIRTFDGWGSEHMYFSQGDYFVLYDKDNNVVDEGGFRDRAGSGYEYQSGILEIEVTETPASVTVACYPDWAENTKSF
jgi:hypothetical protein